MPDDDIATDDEVVALAEEQMAAIGQRLGGVDTSAYVDVGADVVSASVESGPPFAYVNTYRMDPLSGRMMRLKVVFNEVDDPMVGFAYMRAITSKEADPKTRKRMERKLWKVCVHGTARSVGGKEVIDEETIHTERFYDSFAKRPQFRAELTNHCLVHVGVLNQKFAGIDQAAFIPAGNLVESLPDDAPATPAALPTPPDSAESTSGSGATQTATSTASPTSATSPDGMASAPLTYSSSGPPKRSKPRGSPPTVVK